MLAHKTYNKKTTYFFGLANSIIHRASAKQMFFRHAIATSGSNCPTELLCCEAVCGWRLFLTPLQLAYRGSRQRLLAVAADAVLLPGQRERETAALLQSRLHTSTAVLPEIAGQIIAAGVHSGRVFLAPEADRCCCCCRYGSDTRDGWLTQLAHRLWSSCWLARVCSLHTEIIHILIAVLFSPTL